MEKSNSRIHIWIYTVLGAGLIAAIIWGFTLQKSSHALTTTLENQYNRAFHELVNYIDDIDTLLSKSQLASSPAQLASISSDIFRQSAEAKSCLGQLPTSDIQLDNTAKFLSQVGDYTYVLSQDMINGTNPNEEAYENLASLNEYSSSLKDSLSKIQAEIYSGNIQFSSIGKKRSSNTVDAAGNDILADLENVEKSFEEYPSLIYDGPFSEHIENQQSVMLQEAEEISREEALKRAEEFLNTTGLEFEAESENTAIAAYTFCKTNENDEHLCVSVTKKGGNILYFLNNVRVDNENIDINEATDNARKFLEEHGFTDMANSYYETANGIATINFAALQGDIVCYSDLVKVRVALDTGNIVGMESKGYLMNHKTRDLSEPALSMEEAQNHVSTHLGVNATRLVLIPKDSLREVLCYEFKGEFNGKNFLVYVNADNGHEEEILMLLESDSGVLTV